MYPADALPVPSGRTEEGKKRKPKKEKGGGGPDAKKVLLPVAGGKSQR